MLKKCTALFHRRGRGVADTALSRSQHWTCGTGFIRSHRAEFIQPVAGGLISAPEQVAGSIESGI
jgi:hypothetical protein